MRPYTICLMMTSLDGKIDPPALRLFSDDDLYDRMHERLEGDAWLCGRTTLQADFSDYMEPRLFQNNGTDPVGAATVHVAGRKGGFAIAADTHGQMLWKSGQIEEDYLIVLTTEGASSTYLETLRERGVSYVVAGREHIDFAAAFEVLREQFGIERLLLEGGGHLNGAVLEAGLLDEFSLLLLPGIDGRQGPSASFDGRPVTPLSSYPTSLTSLERLENDVLWLRYAVHQRKE